MYKKFCLPLLLLLFCVVARHHVMAQFTLSAEIRPRVEYRNGFKTVLPKDADAAFFVEQRTRLNALFVSEKFDVRLSLQDVRTWGAAAQVYKSDPSLQNVYEAWASYKFNSMHSIAVGRMELDYDNVRILGNLDWAAQGRSHDLIKYEYNGDGMRLHVGVAFNQDAFTPEPAKLSSTFYGVAGNYKTMQYAWFHKDWKQSGLSVLLLNNGVQSPADSSVTFTQTFGFYGTKNLGSTRLEYDAYYQVGESIASRDVAAYMFGINATFWNNRPSNVSVGADFLSGDKPDTSGKDEGFNPLYGTHHKFYGFMDHFYVGNPHGNKGIVDVFARAKFKTGQKSSLLVHGHQFFAQSNIINESSESLSASLGTEIDLVYVLNVAPGVVLNVGWSAMRQTESLEFVKGVADGKTPTWGWAMISFKPTLFTTKNNADL